MHEGMRSLFKVAPLVLRCRPCLTYSLSGYADHGEAQNNVQRMERMGAELLRLPCGPLNKHAQAQSSDHFLGLGEELVCFLLLRLTIVQHSGVA